MIHWNHVITNSREQLQTTQLYTTRKLSCQLPSLFKLVGKNTVKSRTEKVKEMERISQNRLLVQGLYIMNFYHLLKLKQEFEGLKKLVDAPIVTILGIAEDAEFTAFITPKYPRPSNSSLIFYFLFELPSKYYSSIYQRQILYLKQDFAVALTRSQLSCFNYYLVSPSKPSYYFIKGINLITHQAQLLNLYQTQIREQHQCKRMQIKMLHDDWSLQSLRKTPGSQTSKLNKFHKENINYLIFLREIT